MWGPAGCKAPDILTQRSLQAHLCGEAHAPALSSDSLLSREATFFHISTSCKTVSFFLKYLPTHCVYLANSYSSFSTLILNLPHPNDWSFLPQHLHTRVQNHSPSRTVFYYLLTYMLTLSSRAEVATCPSLYLTAFKVWDRINLNTCLERERERGERNI